MDFVDDYLFEGLHLLIAEDGSVEAPSRGPLLQLVDDQFWVNNHAHVLACNSRSDLKYLFYALQTVPVRPFLTGSVQAKLSQANMNRIPVPYPERAIREGIVSVLGSLDDKIELNRKMSATLEAIARALFKSWFVDFDPVRAKAEGRDTGLPPWIAALFPDSFDEHGSPTGWVKSSISESAEVVYGAPFASSGFNDRGLGLPLIRIRDLKDQLPKVCTTEDHPRAYLVQPGDLLVGMDGEFRPYMWTGTQAWLNQRVCCFKPKEGISRAYVHFSIESLLADVERSEAATTVIHIGKSDIDTFQTLKPPNVLLARYSGIADCLERRVLAAAQECRALMSTRNALLPKLISGEIRVRDAERLVEQAV